MLILCLHKFGMLSIVGADLESYTYYQRCRIVVLSQCSLAFSNSRSLPLPFPFSCRSVAWSFCHIVVCRFVVLSEHSFGFSAFSRILKFSNSQCSLKFSNFRALCFLTVVLLHCRCPFPLHPWSLRKGEDQLKRTYYISWATGELPGVCIRWGSKLPLVLDCKVLC